MANKYLASQLNGPVVQGLANAVLSEFDVTTAETDFMYGMSLSTTDEFTLGFIGDLIGFPWPYAPDGTFDNNQFMFGAVASYPKTSTTQGFSTVGGTAGGRLSSVSPSTSTKVPVAIYKQCLVQAAKIKYNGLSIGIVDAIISIFTTTYTLAWNTAADITVTFNPNLDTGSLWTLNKMFETYAVSPQVIMIQGGT